VGPDTLASAIPATAWEQAAFVVLLLIAVALMLYYNERSQLRMQKFIEQRDTQWQHWMDVRDDQACKSLGAVTSALNKLAEKLDEHDERVDVRLREAIETVGKRRASDRAVEDKRRAA